MSLPCNGDRGERQEILPLGGGFLGIRQILLTNPNGLIDG